MWMTKRKKAKLAQIAASQNVQSEQNKTQVVVKDDLQIACEQASIIINPIDGKTFSKAGQQWEDNELDLDQKMVYYLKKLINANSDYPVLNWPNQPYERRLIQAIAKGLGNRDEHGHFQEQDRIDLNQWQIDWSYLNQWIERYQKVIESGFAKFAPANSTLTYKRQNKYFESALVSPQKLVDKIQIANQLKPAQQKET